MKVTNAHIYTVLSIFSIIFICSCDKKEEAVPIVEDSGPPALKLSTNSESEKSILLGKALFWDPILSGNKDVACASCHHPATGYADDLDLSIGVNGIGLGQNRRFISSNTSIPFVHRNSPTILNTVFNGLDLEGKYDVSNAPVTWDLRVNSLESQALLPIKSFEEMRGDAFSEANAVDSVLARLKKIPEYQSLFKDAFGGNQPITEKNMSIAIAAFERTLVNNNSRYDLYKRGDKKALTDFEIQGMNSFLNVGCSNCHEGSMFSDYKLHILSVPDNDKLKKSDDGAGGTYGFRTPSLRNLRLTAPYMHNGVFKTLEDVIDFYAKTSAGSSQNPKVDILNVDDKVKNLRITNTTTQAAIVAFIKTLSDDNYDKSVPASVPSKLNPGGNIK